MHREILVKHKTIKFIDFLHADRQTDMVKLICQFLQYFNAKAYQILRRQAALKDTMAVYNTLRYFMLSVTATIGLYE